jgi:hypothetical protein
MQREREADRRGWNEGGMEAGVEAVTGVELEEEWSQGEE